VSFPACGGERHIDQRFLCFVSFSFYLFLLAEYQPMHIRIENIFDFEIEDNILIPPISFVLFIVFIKPICFMCLLYTKSP